MSEQKPVLQALLLADQVYQDKRTKKSIIAGTFNRLWATQFPAQFGRMTYAFISLTDIRHSVSLGIQYRDLSDGSVLMRLEDEIVVEAKNPNDTVVTVAQVPGFPMPHPGVYAFDVVHKGEILGSLRMNVNEKPNQEQGGQ